MTKEEAIEVLKERYLTCVGIGLDNHANRVNEAIDMAIEALQREEAEEKGYCHRIRPGNVEVVVRCKDCRHRYEEGDCTHYYWCRLHDSPIDNDNFCAWGEESEVEECRQITEK